MSSNQVTKQIVIVTQAAMKKDRVSEQAAFFQEDGTPFVFPQSATGDEIPMTGYIATEAAAVEATDTVNEAVGKLEATAAAIPVDGSEMLLTDYAAVPAEAILPTDSVNEAFGKLEAKVNVLPGDGSGMVLTGYAAEEAAGVAATDTVNEAIAKLEARIAALEATP